MPGIVYDTLGYVRTAKRLRELANREKATIWFGHGKAQFATLMKSHQGFYD
ncbi:MULTISPECIES: hypothetical protein [unclassified Anaeromyxobacter]|uniref:hypothetical protein n=1 Tax=unclassified Anaeromyxobacter TaxID=2620896 RepID=UPI001F56AE1F|nr:MULTISPECIES: hypothetical protein [unclassified Anaeromyxobacter]